MQINKIRKKILEEIKPYIAENGWHKDIIVDFVKSSNFKHHEIISLFPDGYYSLIQMFLDEINIKMGKDFKNNNFKNFRTHKKIRELVIIRLKIMLKDKKFISKTFLHLLLPQNLTLASKNLYKTVDEIWFLAGDDSTDFNYYTKRTILGSIYTLTMLHFVNNEDIDQTIKILDKQLIKVSKIPKIKNKFKQIPRFLFNINSFKKKFS